MYSSHILNGKQAQKLVLIDMYKIHIQFADVLRCLLRLRVTILNI